MKRRQKKLMIPRGVEVGLWSDYRPTCSPKKMAQRPVGLIRWRGTKDGLRFEYVMDALSHFCSNTCDIEISMIGLTLTYLFVPNNASCYLTEQALP